MHDGTGELQGRELRRGPVALTVLLAALLWLARMSLVYDSATLELDPSYQQALGTALAHGAGFGRDVVFTSGPLAYFRFSPYVPELYWAKFWLWEVSLGACLAFLLARRLVRRGTWLDVAVGALVLIALPRGVDEWLFLTGLLAADLGLSALHARDEGRSAWAGVPAGLACVVLLAILPLIKVTSLTFAAGVLCVLLVHAWARSGVRSALRWLAAWTIAEFALWVALGQSPADLPRFFVTTLQLATGFDAAMSLPVQQPITLVLAVLCLFAGLGACLLHARARRSAASGAQAAIAALALVLAYKAGFTRADHAPTFFAAATIVPLFLLPIAPSRTAGAAWRSSAPRCALVLATALCALASRPQSPRTPEGIASTLVDHVQSSLAWLARPGEVREYLERSRAQLADDHALPRIRSLVGSRGIGTFSIGDGVVFLNDLAWRPRPVFQAFSVFTGRTARANAAFLASATEADFLLLRAGTIDRRLPSSEDPLAFQVLLRDYRLRANEGGFLLLERTAGRALERTEAAREVAARGEVAWRERIAVPPGDEALVLHARVRPSLLGRARAVAYQTPPVRVEVLFADGSVALHRVAPFALEEGVVLRPWLPTNAAWIDLACGRDLERAVALCFRTPVESAFDARVEYSFARAPDLALQAVDGATARALALGAVGDFPLRYESQDEPELVGWAQVPPMLFVHAPATLVYAVVPGAARFQARLDVPPWLAAEPDFPGLELTLRAVEAGAARDCARFVLGVGRVAARETTRVLDVPIEFTAAGELHLVVRPLPGGDPGLAGVGLRKVELRPDVER